jgi:hypothetical protein
MEPVPGLHYFDLCVRQRPFIHFEEKVRRKRDREIRATLQTHPQQHHQYLLWHPIPCVVHYGPWSKVMHYIGSNVPFGTHP